MKNFFQLFFGVFLYTCLHFAFAEHLINHSTQQLLNFAHQYKNHVAYTQDDMKKILNIAKSRREELLHALEESNSAEMTSYLLPNKFSAFFPKKVTEYFEKQVSITGKLSINVIDFADKSKIEYVITQNDSNYYLHWTSSFKQNLKTGDEIKIKNAYVLQKNKNHYEAIVDPNQIQIISAAKAIPNAFGEQKTIVFLVNFQDDPNNKPFTNDEVLNTLNQINNLYDEFSYHQTSLSGKVIGWYTVALNSTDGCDVFTNQVPDLAEQAALKAGVDLSPYKHRVYIWPRNNCGWAGLGQAGTPDNGYSKAWINGWNTIYVIGHELGHNLGIIHSRLLKCPNSPDQGSCTTEEYSDLMDIMGRGLTGHFNAVHKDRLGWLNYGISPPINTITASGTYTIDAYETSNSNVKALKILREKLADGSNEYYYLEFRQPIGWDSFLGNCGTNCDFTKGVVIHKGDPNKLQSSDLLDMTPEDNNNNFVALLPGKTFSNPNAPNGGVDITVNSVSATGASVKVNFGGKPPVCEHATHTLAISPSFTQWINAGLFADYTLTLTNNDTISCAPLQFILTSSVYSGGLKANLNTQWVSLEPGKSKTINLRISSNTGIPTGVYIAGISATNKDNSLAVSAIAKIGINP